MPVVPKPKGQKLFGGRSVIMLGGVNIEAMRQWQKRVRAAEGDVNQDDVSSNADAAGDCGDDGTSTADAGS